MILITRMLAESGPSWSSKLKYRFMGNIVIVGNLTGYLNGKWQKSSPDIHHI